MQPMLLHLRKQFRERTYRKSAYETNRSGSSQIINFAEYENSASRHEIPNQHKKVEVSRVNAEGLLVRNHLQSFRDGPLPSPLASPKEISTLRRDHSQSSQRPFYYLEDNEIISVESFGEVYNDVMAYQKQQQKVFNKEKLDNKRKKIEEIQNSISRQQSACKSLSISTVDFQRQMKAVSDPSPLVKIENQGEDLEVDSAQKLVTLSQIMGNMRSPSRVISTQEDNSPGLSHYFKKQGRKYVRGVTTEGETTMTMITNTSDQKLTEKEVNRHLISLTASPRVMRNVTSARKEKNFTMMFKDPKTMESAVENSIRSAHKQLIRKISSAESNRFESVQIEGVMSPLSSLDELDKVEKLSKIKERDMMFNNGSFAVSTRAEDEKKGKAVGKKIQDNIKRIDSVLRSSFISLSGLSSPKKPLKAEPEGLRAKNKFPLRSAVAQKYNFNEKVSDHKRMTLKIRKISSAYKKDIKTSSMNSQSYVSFYN